MALFWFLKQQEKPVKRNSLLSKTEVENADNAVTKAI